MYRQTDNDDIVKSISRSIDRQYDDRHRQRSHVKRRKKSFFAFFFRFIAVLLIIALAGCGAAALFAKQPVILTEGVGTRQKGCSTILIAGTDKGGNRTDTIMLLSVNSAHRTYGLMSIPRDTYCDGYKTPKINATLGIYGGGEEGMEALMDRVAQKIGFYPDGYMLVDLDAFIEIVDTMGGVDFDVPMDMQYSDPVQDLTIDLKKGYQHLDGYQAMGLVRFRKGYARADLQRVEVQRDFMAACRDQWVSVKGFAALPKVLKTVKENVVTDLSVSNMLWIAKAVLLRSGGDMETMTLPGEAKTIGGVSYYVVSDSAPDSVKDAGFSPYA